ncbi:MAG: Omp28-related outer membrane protein, partial [Flavobacteriales bacterium]
MKKLLLFSAFSAAMFAVESVQAQVAKMPFVEHFTQASCGPCASQNPTMYTTLNNFGSSNYVKLTYQVSWPGFDPMYNEYGGAADSRVSYYGVTGVPNATLNGSSPVGPNTAVTASTLANKAAEMTDYSMTVTHSWGSGNNVTVNVDVTNETATPISVADKIYVAMTEDHVSYPSAPGSNGETDFYYVVRQFYNASSGALTNDGIALGTIAANATTSFSFTITDLPSYIKDYNELSFVSFIQNNASKDIEQAAKSTAGNVPGLLDVATTSNSTVGSGYCDYSFTPSVNFTNNGSSSVTTVTAEYTINGGTAISQTYNTGSIAQGQTQAITFPSTTLSAGNSDVVYSITDVNNGALYSPGPNNPGMETFTKISNTANTDNIEVAFDGLAVGTAAPAGAIADNPNSISAYTLDNTAVTAVTWDLGGFGESNGCFFWDYFLTASGGSSKIVFEKLDLTGKSNYKLKFSHAHALYAGTENDKLKINVSTDCGSTWTTVWDKSGSDLATVDPVGNNTRFFPKANEWVSNLVDLSAYDGNSELMIAFEGTSGYGNSLYIDDIQTGENLLIGTEEFLGGEAINITPNPTNDVFTLNTSVEG